MQQHSQQETTNAENEFATLSAPRMGKYLCGALAAMAAVPAVGFAAEEPIQNFAPAAVQTQQQEDVSNTSPREAAWEKVQNFNRSLFHKTEEERARLTREFYPTLQTDIERLIGAENLGGPNFFRPNIPRAAALDVVQPLLNDSDTKVQIAALQALQRLDGIDLHVARVIELSNSNDAQVRVAALCVMGNATHAEFTARLMSALQEQNPSVRSAALSTLAGKLEPDQAAAQLKRFFDDPDADVRVTAVQSLGRLAFNGHAEIFDKLLVRLNDTDISVMREAVTAILVHAPQIGDQPSVLGNALEAKLSSGDVETRALAGRGLAHLRAAQAYPELLEILKDSQENPEVRTAIVVGLHSEDKSVFEPTLKELLNTPNLDENLRIYIQITLDYWSRGLR